LLTRSGSSFSLFLVPENVNEHLNQGSYEVESNSRTFKAMYRPTTEEKGLEISKIWRWTVQNATSRVSNSFVRYEHAKSIQKKCPFWMSNNFRKYPKTKARKI
jgi:hypothetical protein